MNVIEAKILSIISEESYNLHGKEFVKVNLIIDLRGTEKKETRIVLPHIWEKEKEQGFIVV